MYLVPDAKKIGLFNNELILNVLQDSSDVNLFRSRLKYSTRKDCFYEHDEVERIFLYRWDKGTLGYDNIGRNVERDWQMCYLARQRGNYNNLPASIEWKFDYRPGNFLIKSLSLKLQTNTFDEEANVTWTLRLLPTQSNTDPQWNTLVQSNTISHIYDQYLVSDDNGLLRSDLNDLIRGQYGFMLKATLVGGTTHYSWQKTQIFRQKWLTVDYSPLVNDDFGMDIKVELQPDIICDTVSLLSNSTAGKSKELILNDMDTSDFTIILENDMKEDEGKQMKVEEESQKIIFHVHSSILSSYSEYFNALLSSNMIESQSNSLILKEIEYSSLLVILKFIYEGILPEYDTKEDWINLLYLASRFLIPTLVQRCERALKWHIVKDKKCVEEVQNCAKMCSADQLLRFIDNMELEMGEEGVIDKGENEGEDEGEDEGGNEGGDEGGDEDEDESGDESEDEVGDEGWRCR